VLLRSQRAVAGLYYHDSPSNAVDLYNSATGTWTTARLSVARAILAAASVGDVVVFAGGIGPLNQHNTVDLYNSSTGVWTTAQLSVARCVAASSVGNVAVFAGGWINGARWLRDETLGAVMRVFMVDVIDLDVRHYGL